MKTDLERIMNEKDLAALVIFGKGSHNANMYYFTCGAALSYAVLIKPKNKEAVLFHYTMEREEAQQTHLKTQDFAVYDWKTCLNASNGDRIKARAHHLAQIFSAMGIAQGRVVLSGMGDVGTFYRLFSELKLILPHLTLIGEEEGTEGLFHTARITKDAHEIEHIRAMGQITTSIVMQIADFLSSHKVNKDVLIKSSGEPLTIGDVKKRVRLLTAEKGGEYPEGLIFSGGYDTAIPHNSGKANDIIRLGKPLIFDIFPCEIGGGYFYDFTRTWCLGYAPDKIASLHEDVLHVYQQIIKEINQYKELTCREIQVRTCQLFEDRNHPTQLTDAKTMQGYVHGLGHGIGLNIHEAPTLSGQAAAEDQLQPYMVTTIEPGLYYPSQKMGVRIEDSYWVRPDRHLELLAEYPYDLVLPLG